MPRAPHRLPGFAPVALLIGLAIVAITGSPAGAAPTLGFIEHFPGVSTQNWLSGTATLSNPGSGGAPGGSGGYLSVSVGAPTNLGTYNTDTPYAGDWTAAGITQVKLWLNDINADDPIEIHFGIGDAREGSGNFWQYNTGFIPPFNTWAQFTVDLTNASAFTHIINSPPGGTYAQALSGATRILLRHDLAPYVQSPDAVAGDFGVDEIFLTSATAAVNPTTPGTPRPVQLAAPYPNPSRGPVVFSLEAGDDAPVRIEVVDVGGRMIRHETLAAAPAGPRLWTWDGLTDSGERAAAGYYRVRAFGPSGGTSRPLVRLAP